MSIQDDEQDKEPIPLYVKLGIEESEVEEFIKSNRVWLCILDELKLRQKDLVTVLLDPDPASTKTFGNDDVKRGRYNEIEFVKDTPLTILADIRLSSKNKKEKEKKENDDTSTGTGATGARAGLR